MEAGTGSGAVAVTIAGGTRPPRIVTATEISADALKFASANAARWAPGLALVRGDLLSAVRGRRYRARRTSRTSPPGRSKRSSPR